MDFGLSEDQQAVRDNFERFCSQEIVPHADALDLAHEFPWGPFHKLGELGFLACVIRKMQVDRKWI